jgi:hypothetical protein
MRRAITPRRVLDDDDVAASDDNVNDEVGNGQHTPFCSNSDQSITHHCVVRLYVTIMIKWMRTVKNEHTMEEDDSVDSDVDSWRPLNDDVVVVMDVAMIG